MITPGTLYSELQPAKTYSNVSNGTIAYVSPSGSATTNAYSVNLTNPIGTATGGVIGLVNTTGQSVNVDMGAGNGGIIQLQNDRWCLIPSGLSFQITTPTPA